MKNLSKIYFDKFFWLAIQICFNINFFTKSSQKKKCEEKSSHKILQMSRGKIKEKA